MSGSILFVSSHSYGTGRLAVALADRVLTPGVRIAGVGLHAGGIDPCLEAVLWEFGINPEKIRPRTLDQVAVEEFDTRIALSDEAAEELTKQGLTFEQWDVRAAAESAQPASIESEKLVLMRSIRDELLVSLEQLHERIKPPPAIGILGGSGFYDLPGVSDVREIAVTTPYGEPSDVYLEGTFAGRRVVFLPRHGKEHSLLPFEVNGRANFYGFKRLGVTHVISVSAVGSLREDIEPGDVVLPRQFIDRSTHRPVTFFGEGAVAHVSLADPICNRVADALAGVARENTDRVHDKGTYISMEGPQFSTRAESELYRTWGADLVGMTNAPEARLAREAEICYATLALPTDYDCWRSGDAETCVDDILKVLQANVELSRRIIAGALAVVDAGVECSCHRSLDMALVTPIERMDATVRFRLHSILQRRLRVPA